jgi:AcrR family transcriptional regulator
MTLKETKEKIVLKALQYFIDHDYQSVSLNSIAKGIGITKGGIYHYFNSKDELFMECMFIVFKKVQESSMGSLSEDSSLREVLTALFSFEDILEMIAESLNINFQNYFNFYYLMFEGIKKFPEVREMIINIYSGMQRGLTVLFTDLQTKGVIRKKIDCNILSFELIAMVEGTLLVSGFTTEIDLGLVGKDLVESSLERICV